MLLIADFHGYLDSKKRAWESSVAQGDKYGDLLGSSFSVTLRAHVEYLESDYFTGLIRESALLSNDELLLAADGTLESSQGKRTIADALYAAMQVYDLRHFEIDVAVCGLDESAIYRYARQVGYTTDFIYTPMCPGLVEDEMHASSDSNNIIEMTDSLAILKKKIIEYSRRYEDLWRSPLISYLRKQLVPLCAPLGMDCEELLESDSVESVSVGVESIMRLARGEYDG